MDYTDEAIRMRKLKRKDGGAKQEKRVSTELWTIIKESIQRGPLRSVPRSVKARYKALKTKRVYEVPPNEI